jgi:type IV secretory pathway component VirB8
MAKKEKKQLITRKNYQEYIQTNGNEKGKSLKKKTKSAEETKTRLTVKEKGRRLDRFYNIAIISVIIAIVLVFVLAFVI